MKRYNRGFTIVELAIVATVIGILATIGVVSYGGAQERARDAKIRDAADKIGDAIQLFATQKGHFPLGGKGSTTAIGSNEECADGGSGWFGSGVYICTVEDTLVASGYLPSGFSMNLPQMAGYSDILARRSIMVYVANSATRLVMVYYHLSVPSNDDTVHFNAELIRCGYDPAGVIGPRDSYGMRNGNCLNY